MVFVFISNWGQGLVLGCQLLEALCKSADPFQAECMVYGVSMVHVDLSD